MTHRDFSPKPALEAYRVFVAMRPAGSVQKPGPWHDEGREFFFPQWVRPDGTVAGVFWKAGKAERRAIRFDAGAVRFKDRFGREIRPERVDSGAYLVTLGEDPVFFEGASPRMPELW